MGCTAAVRVYGSANPGVGNKFFARMSLYLSVSLTGKNVFDYLLLSEKKWFFDLRPFRRMMSRALRDFLAKEARRDQAENIV